MIKEETVYAECSCGCTILKLTRDEDNALYISTYGFLFYEEQDGLWDRFVKKIKLIWSIVKGEEYHLNEIVITDKGEINCLREFFNSLEI